MGYLSAILDRIGTHLVALDNSPTPHNKQDNYKHSRRRLVLVLRDIHWHRVQSKQIGHLEPTKQKIPTSNEKILKKKHLKLTLKTPKSAIARIIRTFIATISIALQWNLNMLLNILQVRQLYLYPTIVLRPASRQR